MPRVLCVAEKPSAAKKIAEILSQSNYQTVSTNTRSTCKELLFYIQPQQSTNKFCHDFTQGTFSRNALSR